MLSNKISTHIENILDDLSPYDVKQLIRHEDENSQTEVWHSTTVVDRDFQLKLWSNIADI